MERIKLLNIKFNEEIKWEEIPLLRGAIIHSTENANILFHNHKEGKLLRYSYPLIQYKRINKCAAIVCVGEGTDAIGELFAANNFAVKLGNRAVTLEVADIKASQVIVQPCQESFLYHIRRWLPLNQENYEIYRGLEGLADKYAMMERMLTGNIISFCKGMGIHVDSYIDVKITALEERHIVTYKGVKMQDYDAEFKTNMSLPDFIGLGKGVSIGYGMVARK